MYNSAQYLLVYKKSATFADEIKHLKHTTLMKTTSFLPLSTPIKIVTIFGSIIILCGIAMLIYEWLQIHQPYQLAVAILLAVVTLVSVCMIPRKVVVTQEGVNIHLLVYKLHVPSDEIAKIEHCLQGIESHRLVGAGGFFGNIGLFTCRECGKHFSLITDPKDACIITRKTKMPIVVSVADHSIFDIIKPIEEKD